MQIKFTFKIEIQQMEGEGLLRDHMTQFLEALIVWDSALSVSGVLFEPHKSGKFQKTSRRVILLTQITQNFRQLELLNCRIRRRSKPSPSICVTQIQLFKFLFLIFFFEILDFPSFFHYHRHGILGDRPKTK